MTFYQVKAKPKGNLDDLHYYLYHGNICSLTPFGKSLQHGLENARKDDDNFHAIWIEEDCCSPPLTMEREAVLDKYFNNIKVEIVSTEEEGWNKIKDKQSLWK